MKVEIGAGARAHDGFLAFDVNPRNADVVGDALRLPFRTASVTAMRAVDVLEHISYRDTGAALAEWARACATGASLYVQVPDAGQIMRSYAVNSAALCEWFDDGRRQSCSPMHGAQWRLLGGHADGRYVDRDGDWRWNAHYALFDRAALSLALVRAGFFVASMVTNAHPNICCDAVRVA